MSNHNFALQVLKQFGINIYANGNQILNSADITNYQLPKFSTNFTLHRHISITNRSVIRLTNYGDLVKLGYIISKKRADNRRFYTGLKQVRVEYFLIKSTSGLFDLREIPSEHIVEYNLEENWIRLVGSNSLGNRIYLHKPRLSHNYKELELDDYEKIYEDFLAEISPFTYQEDDQKLLIKEIPLIITTDGKLVCLPHTKDLPKIGVFGSTGKGKSIFIHYMADSIYWKLNKRIIILNDGVGFQTKSWSLSWNPEKHQEFLRWMEIIGHKSRPLPCAYLYPNTDDLSDVELENEVSYRMALSFRDIISTYSSEFFKDIEKLGLSEKYLNQLIFDEEGKLRADGLYYIKNIKEIHDLINEQVVIEQENQQGFPERKIEYKIPSDNTRGKFNALFNEILNSKMFDINTGIASKWIIQTSDENKVALYPWRACLYSDIVPVIVTSNIRNKKYFPPSYRFMLNDLFNMQNETLIKRQEMELWMIVDELHSLLQYGIILEKFRQIAKESRPSRIGIVYATQYFGDIPEDIELVTDYIVSFQQTKAQGKKILENFSGLKAMINVINLLPKYHAIVAGKAGSPLVIYDTEGNREIIEDGSSFKGKIFPSVSQHSAPKSQGI